MSTVQQTSFGTCSLCAEEIASTDVRATLACRICGDTVYHDDCVEAYKKKQKHVPKDHQWHRTGKVQCPKGSGRLVIPECVGRICDYSIVRPKDEAKKAKHIASVVQAMLTPPVRPKAAPAAPKPAKAKAAPAAYASAADAVPSSYRPTPVGAAVLLDARPAVLLADFLPAINVGAAVGQLPPGGKGRRAVQQQVTGIPGAEFVAPAPRRRPTQASAHTVAASHVSPSAAVAVSTSTSTALSSSSAFSTDAGAGGGQSASLVSNNFMALSGSGGGGSGGGGSNSGSGGGIESAGGGGGGSAAWVTDLERYNRLIGAHPAEAPCDPGEVADDDAVLSGGGDWQGTHHAAAADTTGAAEVLYLAADGRRVTLQQYAEQYNMSAQELVDMYGDPSTWGTEAEGDVSSDDLRGDGASGSGTQAGGASQVLGALVQGAVLGLGKEEDEEEEDLDDLLALCLGL